MADQLGHHLELICRSPAPGQRMVVAARLNGMTMRLPAEGIINIDTLAGRVGATVRLDFMVDAVTYVPEAESITKSIANIRDERVTVEASDGD